MNTITIYDAASGRFLRTVIGAPEQLILQTQDGEDFLIGELSGDTHYVAEGEATLRPIQDIIISGTSVTNIPTNAEVTIAGQTVTVLDGVLTLNFAVPGSYPFKVVAWPYLDYVGVINYGT
jgi:hypothetical protein